MDHIHEEKYRGHVIRIYQDTTPGNPRTEWDNLGHMVCNHRRYNLGDEERSKQVRWDEFDSWAAIEKTLRWAGAVVILPLYLYDHSGITMRCTPFSCGWDSGQVGFIFVTEEDIKKEYGKVTKENIATAKRVLEGEVKSYDDYLTGNVYGYRVFEGDEVEDDLDEVDSCWGFYGDWDGKEYGALQEARGAVRGILKHDAKERAIQKKASDAMGIILVADRPNTMLEDA